MRNVIVFSLGGTHHAIELRWVREIVTLGWVTPVPNAHPAIAGVHNHHGAIVPVVDLALLRGAAAGPARVRPGESAVVIAVDDVLTSLRMGAVDEVSSLEVDAEGLMRDSRGRPLELIDPPALIAMLRAASATTAGSRPEEPSR